MRWLIMLMLVMSGCNATVAPNNTNPDKPTPAPVVAFDAAECANALAAQAELANQSPTSSAALFKSSEILNGILNQAVAAEQQKPGTGIPKDFADRVRSACPAIGSNPPTNISDDQVKAIRAVR